MTSSDERKAAEKAQAVLSLLTPSTAGTDEIAFTLRNAARIAATAMQPNFSTEMAHTAARHEAARVLNGVCGMLDRRVLTQDVIDHARNAVAAWLKALAED